MLNACPINADPVFCNLQMQFLQMQQQLNVKFVLCQQETGNNDSAFAQH